MSRYDLTGEKLIELFGSISDRYIEQASSDKSKSRNHVLWKKYLAAAASVIVVLSIVLLFPRLTDDDPIPIGEHTTTTPHESETPDIADETEPVEIVAIQPMTSKLQVFSLMDKQALYFPLTDEQTDSITDLSNELLYRAEDDEMWMLFSFLGDEWTMAEVWQVYGIQSASDIVQISTTEKNTPRKETRAVLEPDIISEIYDIIDTADVLSRETWGIENSLRERDENDSDTVLFLNILTADSNVISLQLYPYANFLWQNGETYYQLGDGMGEKLFALLKGCGTAEFKAEVELDNETARETQHAETSEVIVE